VLSTELSALKVTSIVPVEDVTAAGIDAPAKLPSSVADVVLPPYTFTKSYEASVPNTENVSVTAEPAWISQEHRRLDA
jgi:hypothetical protein